MKPFETGIAETRYVRTKPGKCAACDKALNGASPIRNILYRVLATNEKYCGGHIDCAPMTPNTQEVA